MPMAQSHTLPKEGHTVHYYQVISAYSDMKLFAILGPAATGPEDEEGESVASEGSLSKPSERSGTTWAGEASGEVAGATPGCATCKGMAKYGTDGSKAGWKRETEKSLRPKKYRWKRQEPMIYSELNMGS